MALGMLIGMGIGVTMGGFFFQNMGLAMVMGMCLGLAIGAYREEKKQ